ncbi:hypothetical protein V6N13_086644 [Hibiscus sabdariffa]|uniref:Uncharacterized protein n=1 Tax=Hibiscus sabdariffa TaxID=183260 RepID=A0ABR2FTZ0_9ROSI
MAKITLIVLLSIVLFFSKQYVAGDDGQIKDFVSSETSSSTGDAAGEKVSSLEDEELSPDQITNVASDVKNAFVDIESSASPSGGVSAVADVAFTPEQEEEFYLGIGMAMKAYLVHQAEVRKKNSMGEAISPGDEKEFMENFLKGFTQYLEKRGASKRETSSSSSSPSSPSSSSSVDEKLSPDQVKNIGLEIKEAFQNTASIGSPDDRASSVSAIDVALTPKPEEDSLSDGQEKELEKNFLKGFA